MISVKKIILQQYFLNKKLKFLLTSRNFLRKQNQLQKNYVSGICLKVAVSRETKKLRLLKKTRQVIKH